jgi:hypothetical protein
MCVDEMCIAWCRTSKMQSNKNVRSNNVKILIYNPSQTELQKYSIRTGQYTEKSARLPLSVSLSPSLSLLLSLSLSLSLSHKDTHTNTKEQIK